MRLSGKHFVLHQATKKELRKKHKEYCNKLFFGGDDNVSAFNTTWLLMKFPNMFGVLISTEIR
jgi:hypothetical protein